MTDPRAALADVLDLFQSADDDAATVAAALAERGVLLVTADRIKQLASDIEHYDLSDDPGYVRIPTERLRSLLAALSAEVTE
jgi:vacuolar-type H+-ATPase subunit F/Vma7